MAMPVEIWKNPLDLRAETVRPMFLRRPKKGKEKGTLRDDFASGC